MERIGIAVILGVAATAASTVASQAATEPLSRPELVIADHDWAPFLFAGAEGAPPGIAGELAELCLPATGYTGRFEFYPIKRTFVYLEEGRIDLNVMSLKDERRSYVRYGREPLFSSTYRPFVRADDPVEVTTLADLDALRLGHLAGLEASPEYDDYVAGRVAAGTAVVTTTQESLLDMLLAGHVDAFVLPAESLAWQAREMGLERAIRPTALELRTSDYFLTVSRRSARVADPEALLSSFDDCLRKAKRSGAYRKILAAYGVGDPVVRDPVVRDSVVRDPVVRDPVVRDPVVRDPGR